MVHDFSGFYPVIRLGESLSVPSYFVIVSIAFCISLFVLVARARKLHLNRNTALDLSLVVMVSGFIGARLLHVFFEAPAHYAEDPWRVFEVWRGGFVWFGGVIAAGLFAAFFLRIKALPAGRWLDLFAPVLALGYGLGRVACLFAGCCHGDVCELPSGVLIRYPTQGFAALWELAVFALLLKLERARSGSAKPARFFRPSGQLFIAWIILHAIGRMIMELFRADDRGPQLASLSLATWISFGLLLAGVTVFIRNARRAESLS